MKKIAVQDESLNAFLKCYVDAVKAMGWRDGRAVDAISEARKLASRVDPTLLSGVDLIGREGGLGWLGSTQEAQRALGGLWSDVARGGGLRVDRKLSMVAKALAEFPELLEAFLDGPVMWDRLFRDAPSSHDESGLLDQVGRLLSCLMIASDTRLLADGEKPDKYWTGSQAGCQEMAGRCSAMMGKAVSAGLFQHLSKSSRGAGYAIHCAMVGNEDGLAAIAGAGLDLSGMDEKASAMCFEELLSSEPPATRGLLAKDFAPSKGQLKKAMLADEEAMARSWRLLVACGMPVAVTEPLGELEEGGFTWVGPDAALILREESERGGFLSGRALLFWAQATLAGSKDQDDRCFDGDEPLGWALGCGMDVKSWTHGLLEAVLKGATHGQRVDSMLHALDRAGAKIGDRVGKLGAESSMVERLIGLGADTPALAAAARIGVDLFELSADGSPALHAIFAIDRSVGNAEAAAGLLDAAEVARVGGRTEMLGQRCADGSGPMHWAARALCAQSVEMFSLLGFDPNQKDAAGKGATHWAARKYGKRAQARVGPVIDALSKGGANWSMADKSGSSGLAALAARGPLEPIAKLVAAAPEALWAKAGAARSAMEMLSARREPQALAVAEHAALGGLDKELSAIAGRAKRRL